MNKRVESFTINPLATIRDYCSLQCVDKEAHNQTRFFGKCNPPSRATFSCFIKRSTQVDPFFFHIPLSEFEYFHLLLNFCINIFFYEKKNFRYFYRLVYDNLLRRRSTIKMSIAHFLMRRLNMLSKYLKMIHMYDSYNRMNI